MGKHFSRKMRWLWLATAALACGCNGQDADRMARVGRLTVAKLDGLTRGARSKLAGGWQAARVSSGEAAIDSRVVLRLRWDKDLVGAEVQVSTPEPGIVRLTGSVTNLAQRQRAVALAQATVGVREVVDELSVEDESGRP